MNPNYDPELISAMRRAFDEIFADPRFLGQQSKSALEIAELILREARNGERDLNRLKASALAQLIGNEPIRDGGPIAL